MLIETTAAESNSKTLLMPLVNGLSDEEEQEYQNLSTSSSLNSKELHRFRLLRAKRWRPDMSRQEGLHRDAEQMIGLLSELLENHADASHSEEWKSFVQKVRAIVSSNEN